MEEPELPDYYEILGVGPQSSVRDIKQAFRQLAKLHHPDKQVPGTCPDAREFRKIREAQEALCDEIRRREYDEFYPIIRLQWAQYRATRDAQQVKEAPRKVEEEKARRKAADDATTKKAEADRLRKLAEEERLAAQRAERERLRAQKEREAEERSREAGRRAQEHQEREARERLRKDAEKKAEQEREAQERLRQDKERRAEERSKAAAKKAREQQEREARERLAQILIEERQETLRNNWAAMKQQAESRHLNPVDVKYPSSHATKRRSPNHAKSRLPVDCVHPQFGWPRKNIAASCHFCGRKCAKYSFRCPGCDVAACVACKKKLCVY